MSLWEHNPVLPITLLNQKIRMLNLFRITSSINYLVLPRTVPQHLKGEGNSRKITTGRQKSNSPYNHHLR